MNDRILWEDLRPFILVITIIVFIFGIIFGAMYGLPKYSVWQKGLAGKAELAQAEYNRKIKIAEAEATKESAQALAEAEVIRATGVAKANKIIGDSLKNNEAYLRYLYVNAMAENQNASLVYVPTEAGLPILEASRNHK